MISNIAEGLIARTCSIYNKFVPLVQLTSLRNPNTPKISILLTPQSAIHNYAPSLRTPKSFLRTAVVLGTFVVYKHTSVCIQQTPSPSSITLWDLMKLLTSRQQVTT